MREPSSYSIRSHWVAPLQGWEKGWPVKMKAIILRNILDTHPVGLMVINPEGEVITVNHAASDILGYPLESFEGKGWGDLFFEDDRNTHFNQVIIDIIQERKVNLKRHAAYVRSDGKILQLSITGSFLKEDDEIAGIVVLVNDVTELHRAHEMEKSVLEEKRALQHERAESMRNLAEAVAHQIRNPVTAIGGFSRRILGRLDTDDPNRKYLEMVLDGTRRLENLVTVVADYTKLLDMRPERVMISTVLETAMANISRKEAERPKEIEWSVHKQDVSSHVDPGLFVRALSELFLNAIEFSDEERVLIDVRLFEGPDRIRLEIADKGPGISPGDMPYIFDPFFTTKAVGVGMGLCRVRRIISEHKGRVEVDSAPGNGTRVIIEIPKTPTAHP